MFETSVPTAMLEKALSSAWKRGQVITHNIANEDTPGYKAKRVAFESLLKKEMKIMTNVSAFDGANTVERINAVRPFVYEDRGTVGRADGNNVDIDSENMELARLQIQYNAMISKISGHYSTLSYVVTGK